MKGLIDQLKTRTYPETSIPKGGSCAVIGNSSNLLEREFGEEIDLHDFVIRFNQARVENYEKHVGSKTSLRIINTHTVKGCAGNPHPSHLKIFSKFNEFELDDLKEVNFLAQSNCNISKIIDLYPKMNFRKVTQKSTNFLNNITGRPATAGFIGLALGMSHFNRVSCYGFDFYSGTNDHYFEKVESYDRTQVHNISREREVILHLRDAGVISFK